MSFISVAVFHNFISIMSDGRVSNKQNGRINIIREDFKKFFRINSNVILGVAGHYDAFMMLKSKFENHYDSNIVNIKSEIKKTVFEDMANLHDFDGNPIRIMAVLCGKDANGKMFASTYMQKDILFKKEKHYMNEAVFISIGSSEVYDNLTQLFNNKFDDYSKKHGVQRLAVFQSQKEINDYIASYNDDVNTKVFCECIY